MERIRESVLQRLYGKELPKLVGHEDVFQNVYGMLESTVTLRKGDSCLIMGPRSSGKTLLVKNALEKLETEHKDQFIVLRLNGLVYSDDRQAFRAIAKQLDLATADQEQVDSLEKPAMATTMQNLLKLFEEAAFSDRSHTAVIFVVEELDRFASGAKQSLLYNLLDLAQNSPVGVAVVGLTCRITAGELLEKRVRSRFSQRMYSLPKPSLQTFDRICEALIEAPENTDSELKEAWNRGVQTSLHAGHLADIAKSVFYTSKDLRQFGARVAPFIAAAPLTEVPNPAWFSNADSKQVSDLNVPSSAQTLSQGLSELEWALLICAARAESRYSTDSTNLVLAEDEYYKMALSLQKERSAGLGITGYRRWSSRAVRLAWERLQRLELLVVPTSATPEQEDLKMLRSEVSLQELRSFLPKDHALASWTRL